MTVLHAQLIMGHQLPLLCIAAVMALGTSSHDHVTQTDVRRQGAQHRSGAVEFEDKHSHEQGTHKKHRSSPAMNVDDIVAEAYSQKEQQIALILSILLGTPLRTCPSI